MARVYASAEEYEASTGETAPANPARLLARASRLIDRAMVAAIYDTTAAGYPSDSDVLAGFRDATAAQVQVWASRDAASGAGSDDVANSPWTSVSAGGLSFSRQSAPVATVDDTALTAEAVEILEGLGLERVIW